MTEAEKFSEERLTLAFNSISCGKKVITEEDLKITFGASRNTDPQNFDDFCRNMIDKYDNTMDGSLTFEEFSNIIGDFNK